MAKALGLADFVSFGSGKIVRYDQVYTWQDSQPIGEMLGWTPDKTRANFARDAAYLIDPTVRVPAPRPLALDMALSLVLLALFVVVKRVTRMHVPPGEVR